MDDKKEPDNPATDNHTCQVCGAESVIGSLFIQGAEENPKENDEPNATCYTCANYDRYFGRSNFQLLIWPAAIIAYSYYKTGSLLNGVYLLLGFGLATFIATTLHELGHLIVARMVGVQIGAFSLGNGLHPKVFRLGKTFLLLSPNPSEGLINLIFTNKHRFKTKQMLISLAGPLSNLAVAVACLLYLYYNRYDLSGLHFTVLSLFAFVNFFYCVVNLFPFDAPNAFGNVASDGKQVLELRSMTDERIDELLEGCSAQLAMLEYTYGDKHRALALAEERFDAEMKDIIGKSLITAALAETRQLEKGIRLSRLFLAQSDGDPLEQAILKNNLAYMLIATHDLALLAEADELSAAAFKITPMLLAIINTRASALILTERYEEGIALLSDKRFVLEPHENQANALAMKALGLARLGNQQEARTVLKKAEKLDTQAKTLAWVQTQM